MNVSRHAHVVVTALACIAFWHAPGGAGLLLAQNAAPAAAPQASKDVPKPPDDPFVAGKFTPSKSPAVEERSFNLVITLETYTLPQATLDALHEEGLASQPLYERVCKLAASGQASLESVVSLPTRSGQRALVESVDECIYPTEFTRPAPGRPFGFPKAYEMRPLGERLELDPVVVPGGAAMDLNLSFEFTRLTGFTVARADRAAEGELQPVFASRKITTAATCRFGVPTLLGTTNSPSGTGVRTADGDGSMSLTFARCRHFTPLTNASPPAEKKVHTDSDSKNIRMVYRFYSMPRVKSRDLLAEATDADMLWQRTTSLPKEEVKLERLFTVVTRSGQRCTTEEVGEWIYGTEVQPSGFANAEENIAGVSEGAASKAADSALSQKKEQVLPAIFTAFEMRPIGWRIEVDPVLEPGEILVDLNLAPERTECRGPLQGHPLLSKYPEFPLFGTQKVTTAVTTAFGRQCFLGTFSCPRDTGANGRQDDGRTWFAFVKVTVE